MITVCHDCGDVIPTGHVCSPDGADFSPDPNDRVLLTDRTKTEWLVTCTGMGVEPNAEEFGENERAARHASDVRSATCPCLDVGFRRHQAHGTHAVFARQVTNWTARA